MKAAEIERNWKREERERDRKTEIEKMRETDRKREKLIEIERNR